VLRNDGPLTLLQRRFQKLSMGFPPGPNVPCKHGDREQQEGKHDRHSVSYAGGIPGIPVVSAGNRFARENRILPATGVKPLR